MSSSRRITSEKSQSITTTKPRPKSTATKSQPPPLPPTVTVRTASKTGMYNYLCMYMYRSEWNLLTIIIVYYTEISCQQDYIKDGKNVGITGQNSRTALSKMVLIKKLIGFLKVFYHMKRKGYKVECYNTL